MRGAIGAAALLAAGTAFAADPQPWQLNMGPGVTETAAEVYWLHNLILGICVVIGILVFGAMAVAMIRFRKSKGAVAAQFSHNTVAEVIWTVVPVVILIAMAWPATRTLFRMYDTTESEMTVKITGYQWMWRYEMLNYRGQPGNVNFVSRLDRESDAVRQLKSGRDPWAVKEGELPVLFADRAWWAEAGVTTAPAAASIQLEAAGAARTLRVTPPPGTRDLKLTLTVSSDARVSPGAVPGFARPAKAGRPFRIRWYSASAAPVAFALRPAAPHGTVRVQWAALRDGWPADARPLPSRPADVMPQSSSDASVVTGEQTLRW